MKHLLQLMLCLGSLLALSACKKDAGVVYPEPARDFTGEYYFRGTLKNLAPPQTPPALLNHVVTSTYSLWSQTLSSPGLNIALFTTINTAVGRFDMNIFGPIAPANDPNYFLWLLPDLDSVFRVGQKLPFGDGYGQVSLSLWDSSVTFIDPGLGCWSRASHVGNSDSFLEITAIEDLRPFIASTYWVKKMSFKIKCRMGHLGGSPEDVFELEGEGAVLLQP